RSGEVVALGSRHLLTIERVFRQIEDAIRDGADVQVTYDDVLGYPTVLTIDVDRDDIAEVDLQYTDLEAMPIVTTLEELLEAREKWEALRLDDYRYLFKADCTCTEEGTFEVTVRDGRAAEELPLDDAARRSRQISPGTLDAAFDDLEDWFTDSSDLIEEGILEVDVRMDPQFGYPRWFRVVAEGLDDDGSLADRFEIIVTTDLIGPVDEVETTDAGDLEALAGAYDRWLNAGLTDYRFGIEYHCRCTAAGRGPFEVTIRGGEFWSAVAPPDEGFKDGVLFDAMTIEQVFDVIEEAIGAGTDVEVRYDTATGQPLDVVIDPEAVAVDGGLAFTITPLTVLDPLGILDLIAVAGPQCPVQKFPPDPGCADLPVEGAEIVLTQAGSDVKIPVLTDANGRISIGLEPGLWIVTPQPVEGLLGTAEATEITIRSQRVTEVTAGYDTGIR
ncbi:MAG: DUF6174 domain-containing protein, partial [Acidimicrobiia bacterium]|nr:DUF6174 domain-containing protein [Acidimicrobiia bacterium]